MVERHRQVQAERLRNAPPHECVKELIGTTRHVAGVKGKPLKRARVIERFYQCKVCGKDMVE